MLITENAIREIILEEIIKNPNITLEELNETVFDNLLKKFGKTGRNLAFTAAGLGAGYGLGASGKDKAPDNRPAIEYSQSSDSQSNADSGEDDYDFGAEDDYDFSDEDDDGITHRISDDEINEIIRLWSDKRTRATLGPKIKKQVKEAEKIANKLGLGLRYDSGFTVLKGNKALGQLDFSYLKDMNKVKQVLTNIIVISSGFRLGSKDGNKLARALNQKLQN